MNDKPITLTIHYVGGAKKSHRVSKKACDFFCNLIAEKKSGWFAFGDGTVLCVNTDNVTFIEASGIPQA